MIGGVRSPVAASPMDDDLVSSTPTARARTSGAGDGGAKRIGASSPRTGASAPSRAPPRAVSIGPVAGVAVEVPTKPRLSFDEERRRLAAPVRPATRRGRWHGHDDAAIGMDHDAQAARPW